MQANELEQAIADAINAGDYQLQLEARPSLLPSWNREELSGIAVTVSALSRDTQFADREADQHTVTVFIGIGAAVPKVTDDHVRPLIDLVDAIEEQLRKTFHLELDGGQAFAWQEATVDPYYDQDILREWLVFAAGILVTYQSID